MQRSNSELSGAGNKGPRQDQRRQRRRRQRRQKRCRRRRQKRRRWKSQRRPSSRRRRRCEGTGSSRNSRLAVSACSCRPQAEEQVSFLYRAFYLITNQYHTVYDCSWQVQNLDQCFMTHAFCNPFLSLLPVSRIHVEPARCVGPGRRDILFNKESQTKNLLD